MGQVSARGGRRVIALAALAALASIASAAEAQPKSGSDDIYDDSSGAADAARDHFKKGVALSRAGSVDAALAEFQLAYDLNPSWKLLYNIGTTSHATKDYARSVRAFERYLKEGGAAVPKARRGEVEGELSAMKPLVGRVRVGADVAGAAVRVDGVAAGKTPLDEPLLVNAGRRKVSVTREGAEPVVKEIDVTGGATVEADFQLGKTAPPALTEAEAKPGAPPPKSPPYKKIGLVATGVLAAGAAATGTVALVSSIQLSKAHYAGPDRKPEAGSAVDSLSSRVSTFATITDILAGAAIITGGLTLYVAISGADTSGGAPASGAAARSSGVPSAMRVAIGPTGITVAGSF